MTFLFYCFSGLALLAALFVILLKDPVRALLSLVVLMFTLAVLYLTLGAAFLAMANIVVYAGAVLVLFLFVIMLQGLGAKDIPLGRRFPKIHIFLSVFVCLIFFIALALVWTNVGAGFPRPELGAGTAPLPPARGIQGTVEAVGETLFQKYLLPFELTSFLLLLGVFAAVALAKKEERS